MQSETKWDHTWILYMNSFQVLGIFILFYFSNLEIFLTNILIESRLNYMSIANFPFDTNIQILRSDIILQHCLY